MKTRTQLIFNNKFIFSDLYLKSRLYFSNSFGKNWLIILSNKKQNQKQWEEK